MRRTLLAVGGIVVAVVAILAVALVVPFPRDFSFVITIPANAAINQCQSQDFRHGELVAASVAFSWSSESRLNFSVWDPSSTLVYLSDASSGAGSFSADYGLYDFCIIDAAANSASVHGTAHETWL